LESISNSRQSKEVARRSLVVAEAAQQVARELGLPWDLLALREYGSRYIKQSGVLTAWEDYDRSLGYPFPHQTYISKELLRHAKDLYKWKEESAQVSPPIELSPALEKSVSAAYGAYSKDEWKYLIPKLDHTTLRPLLLYLRDNKDALTQGRDAWGKYGAVFDAAANRSMSLLFSQGRWEGSEPIFSNHLERQSQLKLRKHILSGDCG
jgi:hypothetical protein